MQMALTLGQGWPSQDSQDDLVAAIVTPAYHKLDIMDE